jgi:PTS system nitrogen regulatory IIA component
MGFGKVLRTLRTTSGLSLRELARELDVSPTYLSLIETGKSPPPVEEKIIRLEAKLGVPPGSLLSFTNRHPHKVVEMLHQNQSAAHFFKTAIEQDLISDDFDLLSRLLARGGRNTLVRALHHAWEELGLGDPSITGNGSALLGKNFIVETFKAKNWTSLLRKVAHHIAGIYPQIKAGDVAEALIAREKSGSTALGESLAIPHATLKDLEERIVMLARLPDGVDFGASDRQPVTLAFIILGPEDARAYHVYLLARIARFFLQPGLHTRLLKTEKEEDVLRILNEMDDKIP